MQPTVFLSHSKKDKKFIEKLANDLHIAQIKVWYDEWEISPGESIRKKIFEDGMPKCNLFFVYITKNSIDSPWVRREIDSALIMEAEEDKISIALFVDSESTRNKLSYDLKSRNIPVLNELEYYPVFIKLVSRAWNSLLKQASSLPEKTTGFKGVFRNMSRLKEFTLHDLIEQSKEISMIAISGGSGFFFRNHSDSISKFLDRQEGAKLTFIHQSPSNKAIQRREVVEDTVRNFKERNISPEILLNYELLYEIAMENSHENWTIEIRHLTDLDIDFYNALLIADDTLLYVPYTYLSRGDLSPCYVYNKSSEFGDFYLRDYQFIYDKSESVVSFNHKTINKFSQAIKKLKDNKL